MEIVYVLMADGDGTLCSQDRPFGVAVTSKAEAERFVKEVNFGYTRSFRELAVFNTTEEAITHWERKNLPSKRDDRQHKYREST